MKSRPHNFHELSGGEVQLWVDQGVVMLKAISDKNDPVELTESTALEISSLLKQLAEIAGKD